MLKAMLALLALTSVAIADPLPTTRRTDWTYTGVPGGVPNRTKICATFSPGATAAQINAAAASCSNGVVQLAAGVFTSASLNGRINVGSSNVTLRGAGADQTIVQGTNFYVGGGANVSLGTAITGGGALGSRQITVASTAKLAPGVIIEVDREDDPNLIVGPVTNGTRNRTQVNVVTAISGTTVTVRNPWFTDFSSGNPKVKFYAANIPSQIGVENMTFDHLGVSAGTNFAIYGCDSCWVKGVHSTRVVGYHFVLQSTVNVEMRDNFLDGGVAQPNNSGFNLYGSYSSGTNSSAKIENNIFEQVAPPVEINNSSSGNYIGYNYVHGSPTVSGNALVQMVLDDGHAPFNVMNLYEGNIAEKWGMDAYYGGSALGVLARNYLTGYNPVNGARGEAVQLGRLGYSYSMIGNVLGSTQQNPGAYAGCSIWGGTIGIFALGYPNLGNCDTVPWDGYSPPSGNPDSKVAATLLRWGNYDYSTKTVRFVATEIPAGVPAPADRTIPASYAYTAKPAWWPASVAWPPIGPDVTGGNGDTSGHVNKIPAQLCWESSKLASGGAFNASTCYLSSSNPSGSGTPPTAPPPANTPAVPPPVTPPVVPAPVITSALNATGTAGQPFSYTITATNNPTGFTAAGLPVALSLNATTGVISGTPAAASASAVTLGARNATGTGSATLILAINAPSTGAGGPTGLLLGSQTIQPAVDSVVSGTAEAFQTRAGASGTVSSLSVYIDASSTARTLVAGIYADAGGHPGLLISQGASAALTPGAWNRVTIPAATVAAGTKYWLALLGSSGVLSFRDGPGCSSETSRQTWLTTLPAAWSTGAVWQNSCGLSAFGK